MSSRVHYNLVLLNEIVTPKIQLYDVDGFKRRYLITFYSGFFFKIITPVKVLEINKIDNSVEDVLLKISCLKQIFYVYSSKNIEKKFIENYAILKLKISHSTQDFSDLSFLEIEEIILISEKKYFNLIIQSLHRFLKRIEILKKVRTGKIDMENINEFKNPYLRMISFNHGGVNSASSVEIYDYLKKCYLNYIDEKNK